MHPSVENYYLYLYPYGGSRLMLRLLLVLSLTLGERKVNSEKRHYILHPCMLALFVPYLSMPWERLFSIRVFLWTWLFYSGERT